MPRRFEFQEGNSSKFWEIELEGSSVTTWWGKIGTAGQNKTKDCGTPAMAQKEYDKLLAEKTGKGYEEVGGGSPPPKLPPVVAPVVTGVKVAHAAIAPKQAAAPVKVAPVKVAPVKTVRKPKHEEDDDDEDFDDGDFADEDFDDDEDLEDDDDDDDESDDDDEDDDEGNEADEGDGESSIHSGAARRHFEFEEGNSSKFWEIQLGDCSLTTWWGKIGTAGQSKSMEFDSDEEAKKQYDKLVIEKTKKGYEEV